MFLYKIIDKKGRFVILRGTLNLTEVLIICVNTMHTEQVNFGDTIYLAGLLGLPS